MGVLNIRSLNRPMPKSIALLPIRNHVLSSFASREREKERERIIIIISNEMSMSHNAMTVIASYI
jgi:hypothetical protein